MQLSLKWLNIFCIVLAQGFLVATISSIASGQKEDLSSYKLSSKEVYPTSQYSAKEGIILLENILQKMHNMPQVVVNKMPQTVALQSQMLAIKDNRVAMAHKTLVPTDGFSTPVEPRYGQSNEVGTMYDLDNKPLAEQNKEKTQKGASPIVSAPHLYTVSQDAISQSKSSGYYRQSSNMDRSVVSKPFATPQMANKANKTLKAAGQIASSPAPSMGASLPPPPDHMELGKKRGRVLFRQDEPDVISQLPESDSLLHRRQYEYSERQHLIPQLKAAPVIPKEEQVALLPPTVITGISLVQLGNSQKEVDKTLSKLGKVKKEVIDNWSVWSVCKPKSNDYSIQIFMRKGIVEAIRIFDLSLLRSDFAINLGDGLSKVKAKFGEPAFILSGNPSTITQNYIYPISQIGFQFSRTKEESAPQIKSIIVFNVK